MELHQTDLYQIWTEPALQDFLQKPRTKIPTSEGFGPTLQECEALQMKDAFVALLTIEYNAWKIVGGFRFQGDPETAEKIGDLIYNALIDGYDRYLVRHPSAKVQTVAQK